MCVHLHDSFTESPDIRLPAPKFISLFLNGPDYPPSSTSSKPQSLNLTIICHPLENSDPIFISYDGSRLNVEWTASAGCPLQGDGGNKDDDKKDDKKEDQSPNHESVGSGLGWFFLACVIYPKFESFPWLTFYLE